MLEKLQEIPFRSVLLSIKFLTQISVDLLHSPSAIEEFPNPCRDGVFEAIDPSDLRPRLFDGNEKDYPLDHSPGKQWILFESLVDEVLQLFILDSPDVGPIARLA